MWERVGSWVLRHRTSLIVVPPLAGYTHHIWLYKVDLDPAVNKEFLPHGYTDIRCVIMLDLPETMLKGMPTLLKALDHSKTITTFGEGSARILVRRLTA